MPFMLIYTRDEIEKLIGRLGVSQAEFARRCGVHRSAVHHWLAGRCLPRVKEQIAINKAAQDALSAKVG